MTHRISRLGLALAPVALGASLYACTASPHASTTSSSSSSAASSTSGMGGAGGKGGASHAASTSSGAGGLDFDGGTGSGGGGPVKDCKDSTKLVYVIDESNNLYSFDPPKLAVQQVGTINCPQGGGQATPFSMAVDRGGTAWVLFNDGHIYWVDTTNASCQASGFPLGQDANFQLFGMGFVSDKSGSSSETLYVASYSGTGVATIDTQTLKLTPVGAYDQIKSAAELTGTGDARLFGFFTQGVMPGGTPIIAEIDKTNSHILSQAPQPSIAIGAGWAFAFWGGSFYLFTAPMGKSKVDKYDPMAGTTKTVLPGLGNVIVGAGVSTCAPVKPPA